MPTTKYHVKSSQINDWGMFTADGDQVVQLEIYTTCDVWKSSIPNMRQRGISPMQIALQITNEIVQGVLARGNKHLSQTKKRKEKQQENENIQGNVMNEAQTLNPYFEVQDSTVRENICYYLMKEWLCGDSTASLEKSCELLKKSL